VEPIGDGGSFGGTVSQSRKPALTRSAGFRKVGLFSRNNDYLFFLPFFAGVVLAFDFAAGVVVFAAAPAPAVGAAVKVGLVPVVVGGAAPLISGFAAEGVLAGALTVGSEEKCLIRSF